MFLWFRLFQWSWNNDCICCNYWEIKLNAKLRINSSHPLGDLFKIMIKKNIAGNLPWISTNCENSQQKRKTAASPQMSGHKVNDYCSLRLCLGLNAAIFHLTGCFCRQYASIAPFNHQYRLTEEFLDLHLLLFACSAGFSVSFNPIDVLKQKKFIPLSSEPRTTK